MSARIDWRTATEAEKNACFGEHVAGIDTKTPRRWLSGDCVTQMIAPAYVPDYLHSVDALLPWAEKVGRVDIELHPGGECYCGIYTEPMTISTAPTLPEALAIALLRSAGVEVSNE